MVITKILESYLAFKRVSKQSDKPFIIHAGKLAKVIEEAINCLDDSKKPILTNQYLTPKNTGKPVYNIVRIRTSRLRSISH